MKLKRIIEMEILYVSMFSEVLKTRFGNLTADDRQRDKYYHNYMHVMNRSLLIDDVNHYIESKRPYGFANFRIEHQIPLAKLKHALPYTVQMNGYFSSPIDELRIHQKREVIIRKVTEEDQNRFFEFLFEDTKVYGVPYALGNVQRQKEVLFSNPKYAYFEALDDKGEIIGHVNTFVDGTDAKIDDFVIRDSMQRQGYGSALMHHVVQVLKKEGIKHVYLVTDMMETAKDMYHRWGFNHMGEYLLIHKKLDKSEMKPHE